MSRYLRSSALGAGDIDRLSSACKLIGDEIADPDGFVKVANLLRRFRARLVIRPLLVEGMLARNPQEPGDPDEWLVLVDEEKFGIDLQRVQSETFASPLPVRFRNTVAHELVHTLAFRLPEFGVRLRNDHPEPAIVAAVESATERLSPMLLWPEAAFCDWLRRLESQVSLSALLERQRALAISRAVLVGRLCLLSPVDGSGALLTKALRDVAVGIGQWDNGGHAQVKRWPLFMNFERALCPSFLLNGPISRDEVLDSPEARRLALFGGLATSGTFETTAGTSANPTACRFTVEFSMEDTTRRMGDEFLFVVRKVGE